MERSKVRRIRILCLFTSASFFGPSMLSPAIARPEKSDLNRRSARGPHNGGGVPTSDRSSFEVVVSGLRNPRGVDVAGSGRLNVAEAGQGGDVCFPGASTEEGGPLCAGLSSRISLVDVSARSRTDLITGLLSFGGPLFAVGASGLSVQGNQVVALMGGNDQNPPPPESCGGGPSCVALLAAVGAQAGHLLRATPSVNYSWKQDVGAFNFQWIVDNKATIGLGNLSYQPGWALNPDFQPGDSNAYGLATAPGGAYMVDGGSNTLTWVPRRGTPRVIAAFPKSRPGWRASVRRRPDVRHPARRPR